MRRLLIVVSMAGLAATAAGCLTLMPVSSHVLRDAEFTRYRTFDWGPADALPVTDERLRENPFFVDEVHGAIDTELDRRGLVRATDRRADLLVHYHAAVTERVEVERQDFNSPSGLAQSKPEERSECVGSDCIPKVTGYDAGTLVIDIVDATTHDLVWRGWAEHRLEDMLDEPALVRRRVQDAVRRIFETLPLKAEVRLKPDTTKPEVGNAGREGTR